MGGCSQDSVVRSRRRGGIAAWLRGLRTRQSPAVACAIMAVLVVLILDAPAMAVRVKDVTHLQGRRENRLIGYGLVVGLTGTGDGAKYETTILTLQSLLSKLAMPVPASLLKDSKNVAVVLVDATLPENGVREGDAIDVQVSSIGSCKSLEGGRLVMTPLQGPGLDEIYAFAAGPIRLATPKMKTSGMIQHGAVMEADVVHNYIGDDGTLSLVLEDDYASWSWAAAIAERVNEDASEIGQIRQIARAEGPKSILVQIPDVYLDNPASFIANLEQIELLLPPTEARVVISRRTGTIVISDDVEIGPAVISHNGMSITTVRPPITPTTENPQVEQQFAAGIEAPASGRGGAKLKELVDALNQLHVPAAEIIEIVENLARGGKLTGKIEYVE